MKLIRREHCLRQLHAVKNISDIKVITGVWCSEKSELMDACLKMIIVRTKHVTMEKDGVRIVDIARWLSDSQ